MKCPNCKEEVPDSAKMCGYCGTKLRQPAVEAPKAAPAARPAPVKAEPGPSLLSGLPKWALPAGIIAAVVLAAVILFFVLRPGPGAKTAIVEAPQEVPVQGEAPPVEAEKEEPAIAEDSEQKGEEISVHLPRTSGEPYYASTNDTIRLYTGWAADTEEYIADYLDAVEFKLTLDGEEIVFDEISDTYEFEGGYGVDHAVIVGPLKEGTHTAELRTWFKYLIEDGGEYTYGPGGDYEEFIMNKEIIVE